MNGVEKKNAAPVRDRQLYERIYAVVRQVPEGQVTTYGQVALVAGAPSPRIVGYAMSTLPAGSSVPWHRVINSQGRISARKDGGAESPEQRRLLEAEAVRFDRTGRVDFARVAWPGPGWQWLQDNGFDIETLTLKSQRLGRSGVWCRWRL